MSLTSPPPSAAALFDFTNALVPVRRAWVQAANHVLSEFDMPSSLAMTLIVVARAGQAGVRQHTLAEEVGVNRGGMVRLVDQAVQAGLVERRDDQVDRRAKVVCALPKGQALAGKLEQVIADLRAQTMAGFSAAEIDIATRMMRRFEAQIQDYMQAHRKPGP